jgi:nicotinamidase-related amidase
MRAAERAQRRDQHVVQEAVGCGHAHAAFEPRVRCGELAAFVPELTPGAQDLVLVKATGGAFSRTKLDDELHWRGVDTLIVAGLMTHLAVLATADDGSLLGYRVLVAADATATRTLPGAGVTASIDAKTLQRASLATLADRVADVLPSVAIANLPVLR